MMKKLFYLLFLVLVLASCSSSQSEHEKVITDFLETKNGVKTDLQIKYSKFEISDILVSDSIAILNEQFETERTKKIESVEQTIRHKEKSIAEQQGKNNKLVAKVLIKKWEDELAREQQYLLDAQNWKPNYLDKYSSYTPSDILAKQVNATFSYYNPKLQTRQETSALFVLSSDGQQCISMIRQK